jgi:hypothetical protein
MATHPEDVSSQPENEKEKKKKKRKKIIKTPSKR